MKKLLMTIIAVVLCYGLWGCSSQDKTQYNEATNQHESIRKISFQVPISWKKADENPEYMQYSEHQKDGKLKNSLTVTFAEETNLITEKADVWRTLKAAAKQRNEISDIKQSSTTIANMPAIKMEYTEKDGSKKAIGKVILLQEKNDIIMIMFYSESKAGHEDFDKVVDSIKVKTM